MARETDDIYIWLNSDMLFTPAESQALEERLRRETGLRVGSEVQKFPSRGGGAIGPPGDVLIALLQALAALDPTVRDVLVGTLAAALWDAVKASFVRQKEEGWRGEGGYGGLSQGTFIFQKRDEEGRLLHGAVVTTNDPEIIKEGIHACIEEREPTLREEEPRL